MARTFTPRTSAPSTSNRYYISTTKGGLNQCIVINKTTGSCLPNCVGYAWGRACEAWGEKPKLSRGNAEDWYLHKDGYKRGKTPKVGSVICWRKGKAGYGADGAGHVAFVEKVNGDGSILVSQSNYSGTRFFTATIKSPYKYGAGLTFQGFIYPPVTLTPAKAKSSITLVNVNAPTAIKKGNYFTIRGTIKSALTLKRVEVGIVQGGKYVYHYDKKGLNQKSFDIHNADRALAFRKLKAGTYYYRIWAWDANGAHRVLNKKFTVK